MEQTKLKDSGVQWIGKIPEEWGLKKIKYLFNIGRGRVISELELDNEGLYPVYSSQTFNDGCMGYINTYDFNGDQLTWTTDGVYAGTVFLRRGKYNCTNVCGTLKPINNQNDLEYIKYALEYISTFHKRPDTNGAKIMNNEMAEIKITLPAQLEQIKIRKLLDEKCGNIDEIIKETEEQIETLEQYKKSLITEVVTKGLNPTAPMKDSGIEWIGQIPAHWEVKRLDDIGNYKKGPFGSSITIDMFVEKGEETYKVYEQKNAIYKDNLIGNSYIDFHTYKNLKEFSVNSDDIIVSCAGTIGKCYIMPKDIEKGIINQALMKISLKDEYNKYYFLNIFDIALSYLSEKYSNGSAIKNIPPFNILKKANIPSPSFEEQQEIVDCLDKKCAVIDETLEDKKKAVETLKQYKNSLIYEYVTGKKRV